MARSIPDRPAKGIVIWATLGAFVPAVKITVVGELEGTAHDMTDPQTSFAAILPGWFYPVFLFFIIVSSIINNVLTAYSSGLALQAVGIKASRAVTVGIDGVVAVSLTIYALFISNFFDSLNNFLSLSVAVVGPCIAIYITDSFLRRHNYDGLQLSDESPQSPFWYDRGICWPGVVAEGLGAIAALLCINSPVLVGPVASAMKGADLSAITGPMVAAGVYFAMTRGARGMRGMIGPKGNPRLNGFCGAGFFAIHYVRHDGNLDDSVWRRVLQGRVVQGME